MSHLIYEVAQTRVADLHREAALQRRAALARPPTTRRPWRGSLRSLLKARPWPRTVSQPARSPKVSGTGRLNQA